MAQEKSAEGTLTAPADLLPSLRRVGGIEQGSLRLLWNGHAHTLGGERAGPSGELHINRSLRLARKLAVNGEIGFAEGFMDGDWDSPDLAALLLSLARNERAFAALGSGSLLHRAATWVRHRVNRNSKGGSRRNIAYHYDLGNDFYRLWLDPGMAYSSGLYRGHDEDLEAAQERKYARLLGLLGAQPGEHVLEIGCGWGGMALRAARAGLRVTALTLSQEQLTYAREQIERAGLSARVEVRLQDYREVRGTFDHVVSIEMFEAVGEAYWAQYMETLARCLRPGGHAVLQVITIDEAYFEGYRGRPDFIQRYIFPGGMLPSPERFEQAARAAGLAVTERSFHGGDYARTLADWHRRFVAQTEAVAALGFDQRFQRMWRYYLAYCEAGFRDGRIDLMQVRLEKPAG
ncbi:MAG: cyclopropane-fatty-acyl-phospholipid synthase family protein [Chromatiaceae bacterium]|jgi:cyclopropane-fatty-acyl-phospholipid synthase|nr:cyclopropane-fatty-acyl-phospholipid synthase family protein [Chromatiaceae bacterium]